MRAWRHRLGRHLRGVRFPAAGLITLFVFLVGISDAWAVECPTDPPGWPTDYSPNGFVNETAGSACGTKQNINYPVNTFTSFGQLEATWSADFAAYYDGDPGTNSTTSVTLTDLGDDGDWKYYCVTYSRTPVGGGSTITRGSNFRQAMDATPCEVPEDPENDCAAMAGKDAQGFASGKSADYEPPTTSCIPLGGGVNCESFRKGKLNDGGTRCIPGTDLGCEPIPFSRNGGDFMWRNEFTGQECDTPDDDYETVVVEGEACNGAYCEGVESHPGCGFFDDKYICPGDEDGNGDDECMTWDDGQTICAEGAPTPPKPDNGTPGVPAEPDETIDHCDAGDVCNATESFDPETTDNSSRDPGSGGSSGSGPGSGSGVGSGSGGGLGGGPGNGGSGTCTGDDCGEGEGGSASGGASCTAPPECEGDPIQCAVLNQQWRARCPDLDDLPDLDEMFGPTGNEEGEWFGEGDELDLNDAFAGADEGFLGSAGGGACLDDIELDFDDLGSYTIPVSLWCEWMEVIAVLIMVSAWVGAIKIVVGGI